jgi:putative membrane protein
MKDIIFNILKGMGIGVANVIPGVSGGTMAVIFGVYEKLTEAISNFLSAPMKKKIEYARFLIVLGIGAMIGIVAFANLVKFSIANYPKITALIFTILIVPSIPIIVKGQNKKDSKNVISFILGASITGIFIFLDYKYGNKNGISNGNVIFSTGYYIKLFICGAIAAGAMIIPGISGSLLLLIIGEYYNILGFVSKFKNLPGAIKNFSGLSNFVYELNIIPLMIFGIGILAGLVVISKGINYLLNHYKSFTLFFITGLVVVSIAQIWIKIG